MNTILLIEDDRDLNAGLTCDLNLERYAVFSAFTIAQGQQILDKTVPDLILLDGNLPDGDGAAENTFDQLNEEVCTITAYGGLSVQTRLTAEEEFKEFQYMYKMIGLVISLILGGIGILNLINMILTSVIARQKEFAAMRSIGMTQKQLRKLVIYEGICYAILASVVGIALSAVLSLTLVRTLAENMWYMKYYFTLVPAAFTSAACLLLAVCISAMTDHIWNKGSIVEQLREAE